MVSITSKPDSTQLFTTENLDLVCLSNVNLAVDVPVQVTINWLGPSGRAINTLSDRHISILGVEGAMLEYDSTLRFSSLQSAHSGTYTCSSVATPANTSRYVLNSDSASITSLVNAGIIIYIIQYIILL